MNFAYFRKSNYSLQQTIDNVNQKAQSQGWKMLGAADLPEQSGKMVLICRPEWIKTVMEEDPNLLGFLPCAITVFQKDGGVLVGTGQPAIMKALAQSQDIAALSAEAETLIKEIIHEAAGVDELKPTKVKLYSTMSCPYCKMEKSWLDANKIKHELVYVDMNQAEGEAMVAKTGQMGVPVTEIEFDEGEAEYIIGFDKPKLAALLGIK
jgi:glutaredoxin 3